MKRFIASFALLASLVTANTGCTLAGGIAGGGVASKRHHSDEDMTTGGGVILGALVGVAVDALIISSMPDCIGLCGQDPGGSIW